MFFGKKIAVIGCYSTGKTTLVNRLCGYNVNLWDVKPTTSPGVCIFQGATLFDTCGEERYNSLTKLYLRNIDIVILCGETIQRINEGLSTLYFPNVDLMNDNHYIVITQTKNDINQTISFSPFKSIDNARFCTTSALTGDGVLQLGGILFDLLSRMNRPHITHTDDNMTSTSDDRRRKKSEKCCE